MKRVLLWLVPPTVLFTVYWWGLWVWFHTDDFTLLQMVQLPDHEFWPQLLQPRAQGTYRPLSERLFFHSFYEWFGFNAFPYRLLAFGTQVVNLWLFMVIVRRLTGSLAAATLASSLWAAHHGLAVSMSWSSAYNQPLSSFFLLVSFLLFLRFADNRNLWLYLAQWITFLGGFSALENVVVYPALVLCWCLLFRRDLWLWAAAMFSGSAVLIWIQFSTASADSSGLYALSLAPASLAETFWFYARHAIGAFQQGWVVALIGLPLLIGTIAEAKQRRFVPLFGWAWFAVTIAPFLPLAAHISEYYLFFPAAGLALTASAVAVQYWRAGTPWRVAIVLVLATWMNVTSDNGRKIVDRNYRNSIRARNIVGGLYYARAEHPSKTLLLTGIDDDFFYASIEHHLFHVAGLYNVYLAPDRNFIDPIPGQAPIDRYFLSGDEVLLDISRNAVSVYDASGMRLREITRQYSALAPPRLEALQETSE